MSANTHYLIVGPSWVGDMVMAQTLFSHLEQQSSGAAIDVLAPDWSRPLLARMPEVTRAISLPFSHGELQLRKRRALGKELASLYQQAILLPNSFKSALLPWWAGVPLRTGWRGEMRYGLVNDMRLLDKERYPLMVQRFVALGMPRDAAPPQRCDIKPPALVVEEAGKTAALTRLDLHHERPVLGLCPGAAAGPAKCWPPYHYAALARRWLEKGWQVWLFGSAADNDAVGKVAAALPEALQHHVHKLAGQTSLAEAVDLMACTDAVVSNDSGLMHVAAALQKPLVAVYGPTSPVFTPPLNQQSECVRLALPEVEASLAPDNLSGHHHSLVQLQPDQVNAALERVLA